MAQVLSLWRGLIAESPRPPARVADVLAQVAHERGLAPAAVRGRARKPALVAARQEVMARAVEGGRSVADVCRALDRNHATVIHGVRAHARRVAQQGAGE